MMIIVVAVGITVPKLAGWNRGQELKNTAETFISLTRLARSQAIANAMVYRIEFDAEAGKYQLKKQSREIGPDGKASQFIQIDTSMGKTFAVPEGGKILLTVTTDGRQATDTLECINFYPNGRSQKATVVFSDKTGRTIQAICNSPTEEFAVVQGDVPK